MLIAILIEQQIVFFSKIKTISIRFETSNKEYYKEIISKINNFFLNRNKNNLEITMTKKEFNNYYKNIDLLLKDLDLEKFKDKMII